ncbi:cbb3-type cytochrome c oxidase N-terminal domain-containing protein [Opitutus sp. ER46]|uniref:cbb3-type cytochrome c oxidase N-terminal domain-containing protein n=1 Tax=Opitutus sp. ER46 TaxID=2161864 RepID=UPI000D3080BC|nr:cbb3-type cytochrome c oxidase N-terminal domain-containing protein [Opitutus sp. ER46]PTX95531.1 cytochrome C oxidase subunit III [Opitutus sp. ER46]
MTPSQPPTPPPEDAVRPHVYDGIQEYDKRLPNWWLYTLYIMIVFWVGYWAYYEWFRAGPTDVQGVELALTRIETQKLASNTKLDDATLWQMSRTPAFVEAGRATFAANCVACHLPSLRGKSENPSAIGPDLTDQIWIHGGKPTEVHALITQGVLAKGMPTWGPVLGQKKISEVVAYVLSKHHEGEPITIDPAAPATPAAATP